MSNLVVVKALPSVIVLVVLCIVNGAAAEGNLTTINCGGYMDRDFEGGTVAIIKNVTGTAAKLTVDEKSARVFSESEGGCYTIPVPIGRYLVRLGFAYWNFDGKDTPPVFNITLQGVPSATIFMPDFEDSTADETSPFYGNAAFYKDFILPAGNEQIKVCAVPYDEGTSTPFISTISYSPVEVLAYEGLALTANFIMIMSFRVNMGGGALGPAQDAYRRHWMADPEHNVSDSLRTQQDVYNVDNVPDFLPSALFQTARMAPKGEGGVTGFKYSVWRMDPNSVWYFRYYMAEIDPKVKDVGQRVFDLKCAITTPDNESFVALDMVQEKYDILYSSGPFTAGYFPFYNSIENLDDLPEVVFALFAETSANSTYPALLNGVEGYELRDAPLETWVLVSPALPPDEGLPPMPSPSKPAGSGSDVSTSAESNGGGSSNSGGLSAGSVAAIVLAIILVITVAAMGTYIYYLQQAAQPFTTLGQAELTNLNSQSI